MVRKIDDHAFFAGKPSKESVAPIGCKVKSFDQVGDRKQLSDYRDNENDIRRTQDEGERKMSKHSASVEYRN